MSVATEPVLADLSRTRPGPGGPAAGAAARSWRDLRVRVLSASLLAPGGLLCLWLGGWLFAALVMLCLVGAGFESAGLLRIRPLSLRGAVLMAWPAIACLAALLTGKWDQAVLMLAAPVLLGPVLLGPRIAVATVVIGAAGLALLWLRFHTGTGWDGVLFVLLVVWASDSFAYLVGRAIGGPKLAPRISPGKTWSGSVGGLLGAMLVGAVLALLLAHPPILAHPLSYRLFAASLCGLATGLVLGVVSQAGDLAESALKRRAGVKDSGRLIPGHGGLLDRFDGLFTAAPVAAVLSLASPMGTGFWYAIGLLPHAIGPAAHGTY